LHAHKHKLGISLRKSVHNVSINEEDNLLQIEIKERVKSELVHQVTQPSTGMYWNRGITFSEFEINADVDNA